EGAQNIRTTEDDPTIIPATQPSEIDLTMTQTQSDSFDVSHQDSFNLSQFPDPTPDQGFEQSFSPAPQRFDTVSTTASPVARRGKLQRRQRSPTQDSSSGAPDFS